jgi:CheY-like chemotaxis protein
VPEDRPQRRILIVDDDASLRGVLKLALSGDGHEVDEAGDGTEALEMLERQPYDLVLSDLHMPRTDGPSLYEILRTRHDGPVHFATKPPRVIFMTGSAAEHLDFLRGTTDPIIEKPFRLRVVRQMVNVLLAGSG